jgi:hypothetical protein
MKIVFPLRAKEAIAANLVADLPVADIPALLDVGVAHPIGGLGRIAAARSRRIGAVVHRNHRLRSGGKNVLGHEVVEGVVGIDINLRPGRARVGLPVIDIRVRAARKAQRGHARGLQLRHQVRRGEVVVIDAGVNAITGGGHFRHRRFEVDLHLSCLLPPKRCGEKHQRQPRAPGAPGEEVS